MCKLSKDIMMPLFWGVVRREEREEKWELQQTRLSCSRERVVVCGVAMFGWSKNMGRYGVGKYGIKSFARSGGPWVKVVGLAGPRGVDLGYSKLAPFFFASPTLNRGRRDEG
jgi:hypothetical protein